MPPQHVNDLCKSLGHYPKRVVVAVRPGGGAGWSIVTLACRHEVERGKRPRLGSSTLCEHCARWSALERRVAIRRGLDTREADLDNSSTPTR